MTPKEVGRYRLSVETPVQVGEALRTNNQRDFQLQVRRDKIRCWWSRADRVGIIVSCGGP